MPDRLGPMGYWRNPLDDPQRTVDEDRRMLARMEDLVPARFSVVAEPELDPEMVEKCIQQGKDNHGVESGWDFTWAEEIAGIRLDTQFRQLIGSCVATSHISLLATKMLHQVLIGGEGQELLGRTVHGPTSICPFGPYSYRTGRKYAGINGRGDGSTCSGQLRGTMALGFLPCDTDGLQSDFFPEPKSTSLYRQWGSNDTLMNRWTQTAGVYDLLNTVQIRTEEEVWKHIVELHEPIQICSGWGFAATSRRLPNGDILYTRRGSWAHSMQLQAGVTMSDGNRYYKVRNQWGNAHSGKNYFWVTAEEMGRWIRNSSSFSIGRIVMRPAPDNPPVFPVGQ